MSTAGPWRQLLRLHELGRHTGKEDVALVASAAGFMSTRPSERLWM
jgi:hypothetical protein